MKWFSDIAMLAGEWFLLMILPLAGGIFIGWLLWQRKGYRAEAEKRVIERELIACRNERDSISVSRSEEIEAMKIKLADARADIAILEEQQNPTIRIPKEKLYTQDIVVEKTVESEVTLPEVDKELDMIPKKGPEQMTMIGISPDIEEIFKHQLAEASKGLTPGYEDDFKEISGVGPKLEKVLKGLGVTTFYQLSRFSENGVRALNEKIYTFPGRIQRDNWVGQAALLHKKHHED